MNTYRRTALLVGVLYIIGTVAGVLSVVVAGPMVGGLSQAEPDYLARIVGNETQLITGALFVLIMGLALAMIPVLVFPVLKKTNEAVALGYVVFRGALETGIYIAMAVCWLLLPSVSLGFASPGAATGSYFQATGDLLLAASNVLGALLAVVFPLGALMFYALLYQSRLVPRWLSGFGLVAAVLYLGAGLLDVFGVGNPGMTNFDALKYPMALQEMVLAVWLIVKGFNLAAAAAAQPTLVSRPGPV